MHGPLPCMSRIHHRQIPARYPQVAIGLNPGVSSPREFLSLNPERFWKWRRGFRPSTAAPPHRFIFPLFNWHHTLCHGRSPIGHAICQGARNGQCKASFLQQPTSTPHIVSGGPPSAWPRPRRPPECSNPTVARVEAFVKLGSSIGPTTKKSCFSIFMCDVSIMNFLFYNTVCCHIYFLT